MTSDERKRKTKSIMGRWVVMGGEKRIERGLLVAPALTTCPLFPLPANATAAAPCFHPTSLLCTRLAPSRFYVAVFFFAAFIHKNSGCKKKEQKARKAVILFIYLCQFADALLLWDAVLVFAAFAWSLGKDLTTAVSTSLFKCFSCFFFLILN